MLTRTIVALAALAGTSGCMQYLVQPPAPSIAGGPREVTATAHHGGDLTQNFESSAPPTVGVDSYLGGKVQRPPFVLAAACRNGEQLARVLVKRDFGQGLISWLTLGLYAPATVVYECANAGEPELGTTGATEPAGGRR